jgi:hypothetical protein
MRFERMSPNRKTQWQHSDFERNEAFNMELIDAFILNPGSSHELVQRLSTDPTWDITCEEPDLVIFVRSTTKCIDRKDGEQ